MSREEFDVCAASWAHQIAGSPAWWRIAMAVHVLFFLAWILLVCLGWGQPPWLARLIAFRPPWPWWETQIGYLVAVSVWAHIVGFRPRGTFWGWWGTWLYLGIVLPRGRRGCGLDLRLFQTGHSHFSLSPRGPFLAKRNRRLRRGPQRLQPRSFRRAG